MPKSNSSDSISKENDSESTSEEIKKTPRKGNTMKVPEYEKERLKRMEENRARMEALGLHKMANSLMGSVVKNKKKSEGKGKGKRKVNEEDEEYRPEEEEATKTKSASKKKVPVQKVLSDNDFVDDDDALMQAIALSLQDSAGFLNVGKRVPYQNSNTKMVEGDISERKGNASIEEDTGKRKRKKPISSRVQMTEDELIVHFFQFDEAGKGKIDLRDLRKIAAAHDFTWSDMETTNMICFFDSDGDGKLSLDDFRKIVSRCNMLQEPENVVMGSKV
ncbi:hypothetical protein LguiB_010994 [Lonicera macranthoides]